jgi:hypothetical protein
MNQTALRFLQLLDHGASGGVTEVCLFQGGKKPTHVGYFDDLQKALKAIEAFDGKGNMFLTVNPAKRDMLGRVYNRLMQGSYINPAERTKDTEIHRDMWFLLDVDVNRPSGISATDEEMREAVAVAKTVRDWLLSVGVPASAIITGMSGNGAYVLVRTLVCEPTEDHIESKKSLLNFIADKFDTGRVSIDRTVYNPARLVCALGSMKVKGEDIPERPHRRSTIRTIAGETFDPEKEQSCDPFDLYALAQTILPKVEEKSNNGKDAQKDGAGEAHYGIDPRKFTKKLEGHKPTDRGYDYYTCPNCGGEGKFWVDSNGKWGCFHRSPQCEWRQLYEKLRELTGPRYKNKNKESGDAAPAQESAATRLVQLAEER